MFTNIAKVICKIYLISGAGIVGLGIVIFQFVEIAKFKNNKGEEDCKKNIFICFFKNFFSCRYFKFLDHHKMNFLQGLVLILIFIIAVLLIKYHFHGPLSTYPL